MKQWGWYFNQTRCISCKACLLACRNWNDDKRGDTDVEGNTSFAWIESEEYTVKVGENEKREFYINPETDNYNHEEFRKHYMKEHWRRVPTPYTDPRYGNLDVDEKLGSQDNGVVVGTFPNLKIFPLSISCNHCEEPACMEACPIQIIYKEDKFGAVLVDNTSCISCGECLKACPWDTPQFYAPDFDTYAQDDPKRPKMTKCNFCIDRISDNRKPACVAACLNRALDAGPLDELKRKYPYATIDAKNFEHNKVSVTTGKTTNPSIIFKSK